MASEGVSVTADEAVAKILEVITTRAQQKWGEDWRAELVRGYCVIESEEAGELIKPVTRRSTIMRALETGMIRFDTAIRLAAAVGLKISAETLQEFY